MQLDACRWLRQKSSGLESERDIKGGKLQARFEISANSRAEMEGNTRDQLPAYEESTCCESNGTFGSLDEVLHTLHILWLLDGGKNFAFSLDSLLWWSGHSI